MTDLREALSSAFDEAEKKEEEASTVPTPGELMEETSKPEVSEVQEVKEETSDTVAEKIEEPVEKESKLEETKPDVSEKAPVSWSPKARQAWATLPSEVRNEVAKRERDFSVGIQRYAETAKYGSEVQKALAPFQSIIRMEGADDITAISSLAQTAATLRLGTPVEKARIISDLVNVYGVDIGTLDSVLAGETPSPEEDKISKILEQRLKPFEELLGTVRQGREQQVRSVVETVDKEISTFETKAEFLNDVRNDMADILELAAKRGQKLSLQEAYDKAVLLHPEISEILQQRKLIESRTKNREVIERKKAASASLSGGAGGVVATKEPKSVRDALAAAWDAAVGE
jgi:hypothetical protein